MKRRQTTNSPETPSTGKHNPPEKLLKFIEIANLAPLDVSFPSWEEIVNEYLDSHPTYVRDLLPNRAEQYFAEQTFEMIKFCFGKISDYPKIGEFITADLETLEKDDEDEEIIDLNQISENYQKFCNVRAVLSFLAEMLDDDEYLFHKFPVTMYVSNGRVVIEPDEFLEAVQEITEMERLKICPICQHIFWANPSHQEACSPNHRDRWKSRKYRENVKAERERLNNHFQPRIKK